MNKMNKSISQLCIALAISLFPSVLPAQTKLTLDDCIEMALKNNVRIKNADNDVSAAKAQRKSAFTNYFPSISASGGGVVADKGLLEMEVAPGQTMSMIKDGLFGGVTATMPVFTGGQIVHANKLAKVNEDVSRLKRRQSEDEVRLTVEQYFWQVVMLKEKQRTLSAVQSQLERMQQDVEAAVEAGITNRNDLLQVQLRKNETRSTSISVENALKISLSLLGQYIGHPADSIDIALAMDGSLPTRPEELYRTPESSLSLTTEYNLLNKQVDASRLKYKATVGKQLPTIAIGGGFIYESLMDRDHSFWVGGITVSVPLTKWWGGSHEMKKQRLAVRNAENTLQDNSQLLIIGMENKWNDMNDAYRKIGIALESIVQAEENLRLHDDYYRAGTATMSDLLEAQTLYQNSRSAYVEAYAEYQIKKREYLNATGQ